MKSRLSSLVRHCAVQGLALMILAASSAVAQPVPGQSGQAVQFNGSNFMEVPHVNAYNADQFTIEAWIYPDNMGGDQKIIAKDNAFIFYLIPNGQTCFKFDGTVSRKFQRPWDETTFWQ